MEWREHLRAFNIRWARTKTTADIPTWYAIEGKGYVIWVSEPRLDKNCWRIVSSVADSAPQAARHVLDEILSSAVESIPLMRIESGTGLPSGVDETSTMR
jgi:hypothetical protein